MAFKKFDHEYSQEKVFSELMDIELMKRLYSYMRPYRLFLLLAVGFLLISKGIEATVPLFIGKVSQQILDGIRLGWAEQQQLLVTVLKICSWILLLLLASYLLDSVNVVLKSWVGQKGLFTMRQEVYEHILRLPLAYYDRHTVGRLMTRTIHDVDQINQMFAESLIPILGNLVLFIGIVCGILFLNWKVGLILLSILPLAWWLTYRFRYYQRLCYERVRTVVAAMNTFVQEHLMGALTIRNFGLQKKAKRQFEEINEDHCNAYLDSIHHFSFFIAGIDLMQSFSLILVFVLLVLFAPPGKGFEAGAFFTFSLYILMFFRPLADLAERYNVLQSAMAAAERIFSILDQPPENIVSTEGLSLDEIQSVSFDNVWFAYEKDNWILKGLSFEIKKGESVALVGVTGEGKTTIANLLLRFYDYQKGAIRLNHQDIRNYSLAAVRSQFSVVLQDPVIFSGTIAENISLYSPDIGMQEIEAVIDHLQMRPLIDRFPNGLQYRLTERGKSLSVGERQLISIARAAAHQRSFLILDEATANIDIVTEKIIQKALKSILREKTALVIAHRLSTIKDVNRILVIDGGVIVESGSHEELLESKGIYEKLYRLQFADI
jgi:ATP-binding cassette subfamily B protein